MNTNLLIIGTLVAIAVIVLIIMVSMKHTKKSLTTRGIESTYPMTTRGIESTYPMTTSAFIPNLQNSTSVYELLSDNINKGNELPTFSNLINTSSKVNGFYLQNKSNLYIKSVNVTIQNGYNNIGVWLYTNTKEGENIPGSNWSTEYQTNILKDAKGSNVGYTDTYNIPTDIPPGGAFIVNTKQTTVGAVIFNSVTFS